MEIKKVEVPNLPDFVRSLIIENPDDLAVVIETKNKPMFDQVSALIWDLERMSVVLKSNCLVAQSRKGYITVIMHRRPDGKIDPEALAGFSRERVVFIIDWLMLGETEKTILSAIPNAELVEVV